MPYVDAATRKELLENFDPLAPGEISYCISVLIESYIATHGLDYQTINDVVGALEGAKLEFYRRVAVPYEDEKRKQNGDVY